MAPVLGRLAEAGVACGYTTASPAWVMLENSGGELSRQLMVRWTAMLASWEKAGYFTYAGRTNEAEARFIAGDCALLTASSDRKESAVYVAVERVTGTLDGRRGSFTLYHTGVMDRNTPHLSINVAPDSGTGQLTGITGKMDIKVAADGKHTYDFEYSLQD